MGSVYSGRSSECSWGFIMMGFSPPTPFPQPPTPWLPTFSPIPVSGRQLPSSSTLHQHHHYIPLPDDSKQNRNNGLAILLLPRRSTLPRNPRRHRRPLPRRAGPLLGGPRRVFCLPGQEQHCGRAERGESRWQGLRGGGQGF
ncbi:hypothetical protein QC761_509620 [Podospora bellae-mahoneyi]|uniref:Uncharacterized protein n=1 Tax=Podospora bellae-mahoneyi TaxID=2093777 RepID=A0ABR0FIA7_9PEZI|nr:hypothetical protein QC761_509620 [Podospora bellae-mahoneyi]